MKKFSIFIIVLLLILIASLVFVLQNNALVSLKFFTWEFSTSMGLLTIVVFFAGFIVMWLISVMFYINAATRHRRGVKERDGIIKRLEEEKSKIKEEYETKLKTSKEKIKAQEEKPLQPKTQPEIEKTAGENIKEETEEHSNKEPLPEKQKKKGFFRRNK
ncbi:MAG: LapA family protein [Caldisericota bacterium]|nr:LapA family protein [Caldisericota bacterium]